MELLNNTSPIMQEFIAKMGKEPVLINGSKDKQLDIVEVEKSFAIMKPKSEEFDTKMREYFVFLSDQLWTVLNIQESGGVTYPYQIYDGEANNLGELKDKIIDVAVAERRVIRERGRADSGQIGDYFLGSSSVDDLADIKKELDVLISLATKHFEVDAEEFFRKTMR